MIASYSGDLWKGLVGSVVYSGLLYALQDKTIVDNVTLEYVVGSSIFIVIAARVPQVRPFFVLVIELFLCYLDCDLITVFVSDLG